MMTSPERTEWVYDRDSSAQARRALDAWARDRGIDGGDRSRLALLLSELVANAAQATAAPFHVVASLKSGDEPRVRLTVTNEGRSSDLPPRSEWGPVEPLAVRGRGLEVIEKLADDVEVLDASADTVAIAATMSLAR